jgi:hypothetical protein
LEHLSRQSSHQSFSSVTAFFDESGHSASTRVVAIGGAISTPKRWGNLREKWTATLSKFNVKIFHMTDFENRQGEFAGWDEERKRALLGELFEAIKETPLILIGAAVVVAHFNETDLSRRVPPFTDPWYLCYQSCFTEVLSSGYLFDPVKEGIDPEFAMIRTCFFELHRQYKYGPVLFALAQDKGRPNAQGRTQGVIGWGSKHSCVHFQLADMIAYELRKHVENSIFNEGRPTRWPMRQFLKMIFMANVFHNSGVTIPTDEDGFAFFRSGSLTEAQPDGKILLVAPEKRRGGPGS